MVFRTYKFKRLFLRCKSLYNTEERQIYSNFDLCIRQHTKRFLLYLAYKINKEPDIVQVLSP